MALGRFEKLILGTGLTGTDNADGSITIDGAAAGSVATDALWDAKGDLAVGSGSNAADNLAVGSNGQVLVADSGETLGLAWADVDTVPGNSDWDATVTKGSDESVSSNTTIQNDDELFFTATSGTVYLIEALIIYASPAGGGTPDIRIGWGEDGNSRGVMSIAAAYSTNDTASSFVSSNTQTAGIVLGTATVNRIAFFEGWHAGAGGTFRLLWAQNTSGSNATVVRAGSYIRYRGFT